VSKVACMPSLRLALAGLAASAVAAPLALAVPVATAAAAPGDPVDVRTGDTPETTVFPNDRFTVPDAAQLTGKRVSLPVPTCTEATRSTCEALEILNTTDGFDLQPRFFIPFTGDIDVATVTPQSLYVEGPAGRVGLQELTFDPALDVLAARTREQLPEQTPHTLVITPFVRDTTGRSIAGEVRVPFTTMSGTTELDRIRKALDDGSAYAAAGIADREASFTQPNPGDAFPVASPVTTVFPPTSAESITRRDQKTTDPKVLSDSRVPNLSVNRVGCYAFGSFESPQFAREDATITPTATTRTPPVVGKQRTGFALIVPAGTPPAGGWPVAVYGPGFTRSYFDLFVTSDNNAAAGIATIATNPLGHGFGPASQVAVGGPGGATFLSYGRGKDLNGDGEITASEGSQPATSVALDNNGDVASEEPSPNQIHGLRGGLIQTTVDNMALVRTVEAGIAVPNCPLGGGTAPLRTTEIDYYGLSFGGIYGTMLMGTDPHVKDALLNVGGGPIVDIARLSAFRPLLASTLRTSKPSLTNGGPGRDGFTESWPLPHDAAIIDPFPGAMPIQRYLSYATWYGRPGGPETYAPLLRKDPRNGEKNVLYQVAFGDATVPNVTSGNIIGAGELLDRVTYYRNDRTPTASRNPHGFLADPTVFGRQMAQAQLTSFLSSGNVTDPDSRGSVFEVPIANPDNLQCLHYPHPQTGQGAFGQPGQGPFSGSNGPPAAGECPPRPLDNPQARAIDDACPQGRVPADSRRDDDGNTHDRSIDCMVWWEIASGTSSTEYDPEVEVTRAQMARFVANLVDRSGGDLPTDVPDAFTDDDGDFHEVSINRLAAAGIISGKDGDRYAPSERVNRGQMAKFLVLAYEFVSDRSLTDAGDYFGDDENSTQESNINKAAEAGFSSGRDGEYQPNGTVRRDAMASFLARTLDLLVEEGTTPPKG
jgi:hypothetical protein